MFKLGFIGSGFIAQFQAQALKSVRGAELAGLLKCRRAPLLSAWAQSQGLGEARIYDSVAELAENVDAIAVFVANGAVLEVLEEVTAACKRGGGARVKGILLEKPLGRNLREARQIVRLARQAGLLTTYLENQIHMKAVRAQMTQLKPVQAAMGPLCLTRSNEEHAGPHAPWFWQPTKQGGGVLLDMGCHSIAVGRYTLTPVGQPLDFLKPLSVSCELGCLKWGRPEWSAKLASRFDVDFRRQPSEDFATGLVTYENPETKQIVKSQFTDSWMFDKQGLRLFMDGLGPGYAFEINTLLSPLTIFVGDDAERAVADAEKALEKSTSSKGLMSVAYNEADLYGYTDELEDAVCRFQKGQDGLLNFEYGAQIMELLMAAYMAAETKSTIDLTDGRKRAELESFVPLIQQGKGCEFFKISK